MKDWCQRTGGGRGRTEARTPEALWSCFREIYEREGFNYGAAAPVVRGQRDKGGDSRIPLSSRAPSVDAIHLKILRVSRLHRDRGWGTGRLP